MTNIDDEIRSVLSADEMAELETLTGEQGMFDMIGESFRSRMWYWIAFLWVYAFASWVGAVWAGSRFYEATEPKEMAVWGGLCVVLVIFVALGKMWYWMEMNKNTVVRELKRVELQIAFLAKSIAQQK